MTGLTSLEELLVSMGLQTSDKVPFLALLFTYLESDVDVKMKRIQIMMPQLLRDITPPPWYKSIVSTWCYENIWSYYNQYFISFFSFLNLSFAVGLIWELWKWLIVELLVVGRSWLDLCLIGSDSQFAESWIDWNVSSIYVWVKVIVRWIDWNVSRRCVWEKVIVRLLRAGLIEMLVAFMFKWESLSVCRVLDWLKC